VNRWYTGIRMFWGLILQTLHHFQAGEAHGGTQFPEQGAVLAGFLQCQQKALFGRYDCRMFRSRKQQFPLDTAKFTTTPAHAVTVDSHKRPVAIGY
jgi:hypothetical protein